jgi:formimidoylglutamate deiminase
MDDHRRRPFPVARAGKPMMDESQIIEADLTWVGDRFEPEVQIVVRSDGRIEHVGALDARPTHRLTGRALLPGMINAHSHAFQRGLRGRAERFPKEAGTFWTWREEMYRLAESLDADGFYGLTLQAFREMLAAGITTVGEFHYLHHDATCDGFAFDEIVLQAARDVGIRLVLIETYYQSGGIGQPLGSGQRRFKTRTTTAFWNEVDALAGELHASTQTLGVAAHSVRAVPIDEIVSLHGETVRRGMPFHIHVEEQRREMVECVSAYGRTPMALLLERLDIGPPVTAVHCTHTAPEELRRFGSGRGSICVCPLTEGNLGDGLAEVDVMHESGANVCIGSDCNLRIGMTDELRTLEFVQRLRKERRGVCVDEKGSTGRALWRMATLGGAYSLGLRAGAIEAGGVADFVVLDLQAPVLAGWSADTLLEAFIFGAGAEVIAGVCVGGHWLPSPETPTH